VKRRVVITGVGAVTPLGDGADALFERWAAGNCGIEDGMGRCREFDAGAVLTKKERRRTDRFAQLAIVSAEEAIAQAGWGDEPPYERHRIGCIVGTGIGGLGTIVDEIGVLRERGPRALSALGVPMMMSNASSAYVAMRYGLLGPNWGTVSACAAGAHAIGAALRLVQSGEADAVVTGGAESALTDITVKGFERMGATSQTGISRPFDARRDGFVIGEGAGMLVLEEAEAARARGATVLGEILGYGATADGFHLTAPHPAGDGAARAITLALADAGVEPDELDYVNAHGTSTPLNDRSETQALKLALGEAAYRLPVSSTKSAVGHLLGAGGAVEAIATVLSLNNRLAPPTVAYGEREEGLDLDYVPDVARALPVRPNGNGPRPAIGLSNSFGFGGHNAVFCLAGA
jgi:3-oxoacyl-[acyl-carrier-protein] synthase II